MTQKLKIGISACVTGQPVRYDKSHKRSHFCMEELAEFVDFQPVCPEMAVGLPTPRPTIRQIAIGERIQVSQPDGSGDVTDKLIEFGLSLANQSRDLAGFILCQEPELWNGTSKSVSGGWQGIGNDRCGDVCKTDHAAESTVTL